MIRPDVPLFRPGPLVGRPIGEPRHRSDVGVRMRAVR
ncbi:hypothetical protein EDC22_107168 [Tepidamorphus gemmatus]|uniref:Uncharacterized protein n=1 Tax=Tepidamorphus gemmatus TaxID=747076 RepID=A0A4R3M7K0_9HYPH|nr:hypothetical protein EDC22_107168 [Tepidamorphus gemmatus]